jgi:hypothetical protein
MKVEKNHLIMIFGLAILAIIGFYALGPMITGESVVPNGGNDDLEEFAKCLTESGVVMYGTKYCGHCSNQKESFGDAFEFVNYVECTENRDLCVAKNIMSVPAWEIDGEFYVGEQKFGTLSNLSGCPLA